LLAALAVIVTGCTSSSDDADPTFTPPTSTYKPPTSTHSTSAAPTATPPISTGPNVRPGEKPPTFPASLNRNLPAGADAFARYWMQTLDWGYATTDSSLAKAAFAASCTDCARFVKGNFDDTRAEGWHFRGGRVGFLESTLQQPDHHANATSLDDVTVTVGALETLDRAGHVQSRAPAIPHITYRIWLRWTGARWTVVDWKEAVSK